MSVCTYRVEGRIKLIVSIEFDIEAGNQEEAEEKAKELLARMDIEDQGGIEVNWVAEEKDTSVDNVWALREEEEEG